MEMMPRQSTRRALLFILALLAPLWAAVRVDGGIAGTKHDFSGKGYMTNQQICQICHGPHNDQSTGMTGLLWNHWLSNPTYTPYSSTSLKATVGQPGGTSRLCLSCHDGTVAVDSFGTRTGSDICGKLVGTDLRRIHPLSFVYNDALAVSTNHLKMPTSAPSGLGGTIAADLLRNGKFECTSCHEPHNRFNQNLFLIKRDRNGTSGLCGLCHTKQPPGSIDMGRWN